MKLPYATDTRGSSANPAFSAGWSRSRWASTSAGIDGRAGNCIRRLALDQDRK